MSTPTGRSRPDFVMHQPRTNPRAIYHQQESQRVLESVCLAEKFRSLKSLTVDLAYYDAEGATKSSQIKYTVNLSHAKSVFRFVCHNPECVGGDFDLSHALASAVAARKVLLEGESRCQGWRSKATIDTVRCHNLLRYSLHLVY